ncbi:HSP90 family protein [Shimazuella sp. AN120528]|uniref:HSP90 family protein n=1 Tax=Shimazuella soli TaxID=1892854 RepID=UPI001F0E6926|nr:HSP90 family protein [Shimazuella soli]MCH5585772.1 HSP90 family protein [Shimazuella soli]
MDQFHFKVNLKGMIDLLSNHLYSTPQVFVRELIQNAVDAITARQKIEASHQGKIGLELFSSPGTLPTLYIEDNGIGLTEEEVHHFLAQIGQTSKNRAEDQDFIGRFGVGLLSCFIVSDEIVLLTRSAKENKTIEWRGKPDGSYTIQVLEQEMETGTKIYLQSKRGFESYFTKEKIQEMVRHYGEFLPFPIHFYDDKPIRLNSDKTPWEMTTEEALSYGKKKMQIDYLDAIPLYSPAGDANGVAYILPYSIRINAKKQHLVYVKQMLLSEKVEGILPDWAFFVTSILNVNLLKPTASREEFSNDERLKLVQQELGECIKRYLIQLSKTNVNQFKKIIEIHYESLKFLAQEDDELYTLFIDWLPFNTSFGRLAMKEIREYSNTILYTSNMDEFRQIHQVAKAQSICVVNGSYMYDTELLRKLPNVFTDYKVKHINSSSFMYNFTELSLEDRRKAYDFIELANKVLQPYQCTAEMRNYQPDDLPALYTTNEEALFIRTTEQTKEKANDLFSSIITQLTNNKIKPSFAQLCFNFQNPTIQKVIQSTNTSLNELIVEMLYVQALLLGNYPLKKQEFQLLNKGLISFIERGLGE